MTVITMTVDVVNRHCNKNRDCKNFVFGKTLDKKVNQRKYLSRFVTIK